MSYNKIQTINLDKKISKKQILKDINLECEKGKITGIIGPNGSGKSSLFKVLSGLWNYDFGKVLFDGLELSENEQNIISNIGSFIESPNLYEDLTARQNCELLLKLHNISDLTWYNHLVSLFEMESFMDIKVKKYSLGMKQKVGIVLSLIANPDIIILDEPTNSLDVTSVKRFHNLLKSIKDEKIIIISSHILEELDSLCDEIYLINSGTLVNRSQEEVKITYIVEFNDNLPKDIILKSVQNVERISNNTIRFECVKLNDFLDEIRNFNLEIKNIDKESAATTLFNKGMSN